MITPEEGFKLIIDVGGIVEVVGIKVKLL